MTGNATAFDDDTWRARCLAFYLPQFHPIRENDEWWGTGFTEWTNTAKAKRRFPGHYQPHVPADLGFYDLRCAETRDAQAELAAEHGIEGFVYWHYWFAGRRILERPFDEVLTSGAPRLGFCLAWANETWSGIWHGAPNRILIEQTYPGAEDDRRHFENLLPAFRDDRYITVEGRPLFYIFHPENLPNPREFVDRWQSMAQGAGLPGLYLVAEVSDLLGDGPRYTTAAVDGFDAGVYIRLPAMTSPLRRVAMRAMRKFRLPEIYQYERRSGLLGPDGDGPEGMLFPTVYPGWDNTPRSGHRGLVLTGSTPERFAAQAEDAIELVQGLPASERFVFVKSWNEWAEGNHLEPDLRYGRAHLEVLRDSLDPASTVRSADPPRHAQDEADAASVIHRQRSLYEHRWVRGDRPPSSADRVRLDLLVPLLRPPVLDIGAGDGLIARQLEPGEVTSLDQATSGLLHIAGPKLRSTAEELALRDGSFATVLLSEVLEHVGDPVRVLEECARIAVPGGRLIITVPAFPVARAEHAWRRAKYRVRLRRDNVRAWDPEHERRYDEDTLIAEVTKAGWSVERCERFFGSATTGAIFVAEPRLSRLLGRDVGLAPRLASIDRWGRAVERGSEIFLVAEKQVPSDDGRSRTGTRQRTAGR